MFATSFIGLIPFFREHPYLTVFAGEMVLLIPVAIGLELLKKSNVIGESFFKRISPSIVPILMLLPFCYQVFVTYITLPMQSFLIETLGERPQNNFPVESVQEFFIQVGVICLVPALVEEFLTRGVIMRMLKPYGIVLAMIVSSLAFTILHFDIHSFFVYFMLGMLLSTVKIATGSIWASVLMHFSNNLTAVLSGILIAKQMDNVLIAINLMAFFLFPVLLCLLLKKTKKNLVTKNDGKREKIGFSKEMIICFAIFLVVVISDFMFK